MYVYTFFLFHFDCGNLTLMRSWNQPVLSNEGEASCSNIAPPINVTLITNSTEFDDYSYTLSVL